MTRVSLRPMVRVVTAQVVSQMGGSAGIGHSIGMSFLLADVVDESGQRQLRRARTTANGGRRLVRRGRPSRRARG
jgi:hypothetical protein